MTDHTTTIPGGYYIGTDGKPHDANGNPITQEVRTAKKEKTVEAQESPAPQGEEGEQSVEAQESSALQGEEVKPADIAGESPKKRVRK